MLLTKYSAVGTPIWNKTFDVNTAGNTYPGSIALDPSGNVFVTGAAFNGTTNNYDLFVVKYNAAGTKIWHQLYNGPGNSYDFGAVVKCSTNGDVYVTGGAFQSAINMDAVTIRYNNNGTAQWTNTWNNVGLSDAGGTISFNTPTSVTITGFTQTNASTWEYMALSYTQGTGQLLGSNVTNLGGTSIDRISDAVTDASGNIYITGALGATGQGLNIKTVKLNSALNILWTATWNGTANMDDVANGIEVDPTGNVFVAGYTTNTSDKDGILLKYSSSGTLSWAQTHNGGGDDAFADLALTANNDIFIGGHTSLPNSNKDFFVALYSNSGSERWSETYNGLPNRDEEIRYVRSDGAGNFLVSGPSEQWNGSQQVMTAKYNQYSRVLPLNEAVNAPFVQNRGQVLNTAYKPEEGVRYYSKSNYPNLYVFDNKTSFVFSHIDTIPASQDTMTRIDLSFQNGLSTVATGMERQEDFQNYYLGHIPEGRERVPLENKVLVPGIYANIDAMYGQGKDGFFLRLICKPGSSPSSIKLLFEGHTAMSVQTDGSLKVETILEDLILAKPTAIFSDASGVESSAGWVPAFVINGDGTVSVSTGTIPNGSTLIIKSGGPREEQGGECDYYWSTYFGETGNEEATGNDVDASGFMYFTGTTSSALFPFTLGAFQSQMKGSIDAFIACFRQLDEQEWATFYGGNENIGGTLASDNAISVKWNPQNNKIYVVGRTSSSNFPLKPESGYFNNQILGTNWSSRGFIVKLSAATGKQEWATFFGDSKKHYDAVTALHVLENGNIMVGGYSFDPNSTQSSFPYFPNSTPGLTPHIQTFGALYIAEFNTSNEQVWATKLTNELLPLNDSSIPTNLADIAEDADGNIYAVGHVNKDASNDFIPMGNNSTAFNGVVRPDVFIMRFSKAKKIEWSSYLGGDHIETANSIVCLLNGSCYVTGTTYSNNFPVVAFGDPSDPLLNDLVGDNGASDIFISEFRIEDDGSSIMYWSRYLSGPGFETQPVISLNLGANPIVNSVGNATTILGPDEIALTGTVQNNFSPLTASSCPYYYGTINGGSGNNAGNDAIVVLIKNRKVEFSTYWGGDAISGGRDFGETIAQGISSEGKPFILVGGTTNSRESGMMGKTIPVCHELPHQADYYKSSFIGGTWDAFISKIYYGDCLTTDVYSLKDKISKLEISPNPAVDYITIHFPEIEEADLTLSLYDATGHELSSTILPLNGRTANPIQFDIASVPSGLYFVIAHAKNSVFSAKFIKI